MKTTSTQYYFYTFLFLLVITISSLVVSLFIILVYIQQTCVHHLREGATFLKEK